MNLSRDEEKLDFVSWDGSSKKFEKSIFFTYNLMSLICFAESYSVYFESTSPKLILYSYFF